MYHYMFANTRISSRIYFYYSFTNMSMNFLSVLVIHLFLERLVPSRWITSNNAVISRFENFKIWRFTPLISHLLSLLPFSNSHQSRLIDDFSFNLSTSNLSLPLILYFFILILLRLKLRRIKWRISESNRWPPACKAGALASWANPPSFSSGPAWTRTTDLYIISVAL